MNAAHSSILGGSNAARLLACPASYVEQMRSAAVVDVESAYAARGTALHLAIAHCIDSRVNPKQLLGEMFYDIEITPEHVETLTRALALLDNLLDRYGGRRSFRVVGIEQMLPLPDVIGSFGSVDLIMANKSTVAIIDWKFGTGIPVRALSHDAEGDECLNPQLAFYATAARGRFGKQFRNKDIVVAIIQPGLEEGLSYEETDDEELDAFAQSFQDAVVQAIGRNAHRERGEWCRFASCKATCPLWTTPVLDLALLDPAKAAAQASVVETTDFGEFLSRALTLAELAETWAAEIRRQGHVYLEDGGQVPGWKVVAKRATRKWKLEDEAVALALAQAGAADEDIWSEPSVRSVAQVARSMRARGLELPEEFYHAPSSGTTLAREDDKRPTATRVEAVADLRKALSAL